MATAAFSKNAIQRSKVKSPKPSKILLPQISTSISEPIRLDERNPEFEYKVREHRKSGQIKLNDARFLKRGLKPNCKSGQIKLNGARFLKRGLKSNVVTVGTLLRGLCLEGKVLNAVQMFDRMTELGVEANVVTYNSLIHGLCQLEFMNEATKIFNIMVRQRISPDVVTFSILIDCLCKKGKIEDARNEGGCNTLQLALSPLT